MDKETSDRASQIIAQIFAYALTFLFTTLKLTGHIAWSWWWVFSPIWIPLVAVLVIFALAVFFVWLFNK